jgi:hypothetical protein
MLQGYLNLFFFATSVYEASFTLRLLSPGKGSDTHWKEIRCRLDGGKSLPLNIDTQTYRQLGKGWEKPGHRRFKHVWRNRRNK